MSDCKPRTEEEVLIQTVYDMIGQGLAQGGSDNYRMTIKNCYFLIQDYLKQKKRI